mmetsp:Transcript_68700/g.164911  ORF Transcript_68700/g.164911 Transcript_68700/m.164911 type:complete len:432 (+) Transcript_68700:45-1340(+)
MMRQAPAVFAGLDQSAVDTVEAELMAAEGSASKGGPLDVTRSYIGTIKSFDMAAGRGFIECEEIASSGAAQDVYVHRNVLAQSGANVGDKVEFMIHLNPKGLPQAKGPMQILEQTERVQYKGVIKSFVEAKGYGFVACEETFALYNRDVYLPHAKATGFRVGQEVLFNVGLHPDPVSGESRPVVAEMFPMSIEYVDPKLEKAQKQATKGDGGFAGCGGGKGDSKGGSGFGKGCGGGGGGGGGDGDWSDWGMGDWSSWMGKGGMPAMMAAMWKGMMMSQFGGKGMMDWFGGGGGGGWADGKDGGAGTAACGSGKPWAAGKGKAQSSKPCGKGSKGGEEHIGTVKSFSDKTGYGFIACPEVFAQYGRDVFVKGEDLNGLPVGTQVGMKVAPNDKGMPQAQSVWAVTKSEGGQSEPQPWQALQPGPAAKRPRWA